MKRVVFFMLCSVISYSAESQNLVLNSAFDTWSKTDKPASWTNTQGCLKDSVFINSGNYSCRQEATTTSRDLGQKIAVKPSTNYRLSFFYKTVTETSGNGCRVWCSWLDDTHTGISEPVLHSGFMKSETWQKYEAALTSPETAGYFYLLVRTLSGSVTYWDDFVFEEDIVSAERESGYPEIKIYPNPASNFLTIKNIHNIQSIDIQSLTGSIMWSGRYHGEEEVTISVSGLSNGLYLIRIISCEKLSIYKFLKN